MHWVKRQQKVLSSAILSTLFVVAVLSVVSLCCGFSSHGAHQANNHTHNHNGAEHHVILCGESLPSNSSCHTERTQQIAVLPQTRDEEVGEKFNPEPDVTDSFIAVFQIIIPPEEKTLPPLSGTPRPQNNKLLITQLPRAHLG